MGRILITGGAGFIGHNTALIALEKGHDVVIIDNLSTGLLSNAQLVVEAGGVFIDSDIRNGIEISKAVKDVDAIIHLAAQVSVPASFEDSDENYSVNVHGTELLLEQAKRSGIKRIVMASSAAVYGNVNQLPLVESSAGDVQSPYAESKYENEAQILGARVDGMETLALRFFNVYGPRQNPNGAYAAVIPKFISLMVDGKSPTIFGDGSQTRDFVHVKDVAELLLMICTIEWTEELSHVYNVATQTKVSLLDLVELIASTLSDRGVDEASLIPTFSTERRGDIKHSFASIESIKKDLGWAPTITIDEGLIELVNFQYS